MLAADSFVVAPPRREPRALAVAGDPFRTVIAGYHWFTDWGRDTMISLEGLTLVTGRHGEARGILRNFAAHLRDGLIPNLFPEHESEGVYNTADATLWFFHALDRYLEATGDRVLLREMLPKLVDIVRHHMAGTHFGIGVDPADGLLRQGAEWLPAHLDGREGRRLGGHPAARQGGGDQRALVQCVALARRLDERGGRRRRSAALGGDRRAGLPLLQCALLVRRGSGISMTSSTASRGTMAVCARTRCLPSRCGIRCSIPPAGRLSWTLLSGIF